MIDPSLRDAWRKLDAKLRPFVRRRVREEADVDDVMQEIFLRMQRGLSSLRDEERFGPWVYQIARHAMADHRRARARHPLLADDAREGEACPSAEWETEPEHDSAASELAHYVAPFVAMLPSPYREALTLTELEGLSQRQAAEMLSISLSGMKSRVQRGRKLLKRALDDCCHIALDARGRVVSCEPRPDGKLPDGCCP